jgi:hypothetical protein
VELQAEITRVRQAPDQMAAIRLPYDILITKYRGVRLMTLLVKSGQFELADVRFRWTNVYYLAPHQYAEIRLTDGSVIYLDCWSAAYGVPFGQYAHGFATGRPW